MDYIWRYSVIVLFLLLALGCTRREAELGTAANPIKFFLVPSVETGILEESGRAIKIFLEQKTPYKFRISVPTSYIAVVEAFGSGRADVASLNTYGYALAHKKYGVQAALTVVRSGEDTYRSQIITHVRTGIRSLKELNGKKFAFVDPSSTSGYILPLKLFKDQDIKPKETVFAQRHDSVISMIYQGQVDAGATYYSPPIGKEIQDARRLVLAQYPDVESKIKIIGLTEAVPNDAIVFRKDLPAEIRRAISEGLIQFIATEHGKQALEKTFAVSGFKPTTDEAYASIRKLFDDLAIDIEGSLRK
jgi:phosphonate transport system substrate-binding protein